MLSIQDMFRGDVCGSNCPEARESVGVFHRTAL